ncbi:hypothetical protein ABT158_30640 [Nonomuraea sp. NPDC001636]
MRWQAAIARRTMCSRQLSAAGQAVRVVVPEKQGLGDVMVFGENDLDRHV